MRRRDSASESGPTVVSDGWRLVRCTGCLREYWSEHYPATFQCSQRSCHAAGECLVIAANGVRVVRGR